MPVGAGLPDTVAKAGEPSCNFKLGYYFRGIDRHDEKLKAKAHIDQSRAQNQAGSTLLTNKRGGQRRPVRKSRFGNFKKPSLCNKASHRQQRSQCCGVPLHLVIAVCMGIGAIAVLGVFVALPLYLYLDRFPQMQC